MNPIFASFQAEYQATVRRVVDECDRRIRQAQRHLNETPGEHAKISNLVSRRLLLASVPISSPQSY